MSRFDALPVSQRVAEIEDALAKALNSGDFEIITSEDGRYLRPVFAGHVISPDVIISTPLLSLDRVARDIERLLS